MLFLAILGSLIGLFATGVAVFTVGSVFVQWKKAPGTESAPRHSADVAGRHFYRWTVFDGALFVLLAVGLLFLLVDVVAVLRDRDSFPAYHYAYLLSGFIFLLIGAAFMALRLAAALRPHGSTDAPAATDDHGEPDETDQTEQRIQSG